MAWRLLRLLTPLLCATLWFASGCSESSAAKESIETETSVPPLPFQVRAKGEYTFTWFDREGVHRTSSIDGVPQAARNQVRVDALGLDPDKRLPAQFVVVADLRASPSSGTYPARVMRRSDFDALVTAHRQSHGTED